ncbi:hypothetical protein NPE20_14435 [Mucilaginibacter sp. JC4]|uniref:Uncharacterized protein n=1 Tax=Mucilaginibacter aquariorum TaxID=2967225 RepID=A0ABT1T3I6_9SPHI|nr:hypothetical protein [Mucilaginibacter aquariorum]
MKSRLIKSQPDSDILSISRAFSGLCTLKKGHHHKDELNSRSKRLSPGSSFLLKLNKDMQDGQFDLQAERNHLLFVPSICGAC